MKGRFFLILILTLAMALILARGVSAQAVEAVRVLTLSASGYERAHAVAFSSDGKYLAVGGVAGIYLFDYQRLSQLSFIETGAWARSLSFLPGTDRLAAGLFDRTIKLWDVPGPTMTRSLSGAQGWVRSISVSADGSLIASASDDDALRVWDSRTGDIVLLIQEQTTGIRAVAISPDGHLAAGALGDNTVRVWTVPQGVLLFTLAGHTDWVRCLAFSPDGNLLASGSFDKTIRLWDVNNGLELRRLEGHTSSVLSVDFSPDGAALASGSVDGTVRLWQVVTGKPFGLLKGHTDFVYAVAFSPDGKSLVSGGGDNSVRIWDLEASGLRRSSPAAITEPGPSVPSDCRVCHHRQGDKSPARVLELSCEGCHAEGAGLSWCVAFPPGSSGEPLTTTYHSVQEISGLPVAGQKVAVLINSPSNGETWYVKGNRKVPEVINGRVFSASGESISGISLKIEVRSSTQSTETLLTHPSETGEFSINVDLNPEFPSPPTSDIFCRICHGRKGSDVDIPNGELQITVIATTPDGDQARDERWLRVDSSGEITVPLRLVDSVTGQPISGMAVQATTLLYGWRSRTYGGISDVDGNVELNLEALSQANTQYKVMIPSQVVNGTLYTGGQEAQVTLEPGRTSYPIITLAGYAQSGGLAGVVKGAGVELPIGTTIWAIKQPAGPAYMAKLAAGQTFAFESLPVDQYSIYIDPFALASKGLSADAQQIDLSRSPQTSLSIQTKRSKFITGRVVGRDGVVPPFAWITIGGDTRAVSVDPVTGEYLITDLPSDIEYLTASASGFYSLSQPVDADLQTLNFVLVPRPEIRRIPWGGGEVVLSPETLGSLEHPGIYLERGWLWGEGGGSEPLYIQIQGAQISIEQGKFALESPAQGTGWLYLFAGRAEVFFKGRADPVQLEDRQMIALLDGALPLPMESALVLGFHPVLREAPVREVIEPSIKSQVEDRLARAGIRTAQIFTLAAYLLSIVALAGIPVYALVHRMRNKSPSSSKNQP